MFKVAFISTLILFISCNNSGQHQTSNDSLIIEKKKRDIAYKKWHNDCTLKIDTFSFKGIKFGSSIKTIEGIYNLEQYDFRIKDFSKYEITNPGDITIFGKTINELSIITYKGIICKIKIVLKRKDSIDYDHHLYQCDSSYYDDIAYNLTEKYDCRNCLDRDHRKFLNLFAFNKNFDLEIQCSVEHPVDIKFDPSKKGLYIKSIENNICIIKCEIEVKSRKYMEILYKEQENDKIKSRNNAEKKIKEDF